MTRRRGVGELLLFVAASVIGIYAFGRGLAGLFGNPHADPLWLPVGFAALWILAKQMGRIQDRWPRRRQGRRPPTARGGRPATRAASGATGGTPPTTTSPTATSADRRRP